MNCPWCGREMQVGEIQGDGRRCVRFYPEGVKYTMGDILCGIGRLLAVKNKWSVFHLPAHYCGHCKRMVVETEVSK